MQYKTCTHVKTCATFEQNNAHPPWCPRREIERETDRDRQTETDRQRETERERQRDRERERQRDRERDPAGHPTVSFNFPQFPNYTEA